MRKQFEKFLIFKGYKMTTPARHPSTIPQYINSVDLVCKIEHCSWLQLAENIDDIIKQYDVGGIKQDIGAKSHRTVINALKRFKKFVTDLS